MVSEQHDTADAMTHETDPAALSFVGGFVGTITGLKRGSLPGAVVGGFVGGTVGYLVGASSTSVGPTPGSGRAEPILIDVDDVDGTPEDGADDGTPEDADS